MGDRSLQIMYQSSFCEREGRASPAPRNSSSDAGVPSGCASLPPRVVCTRVFPGCAAANSCGVGCCAVVVSVSDSVLCRKSVR